MVIVSMIYREFTASHITRFFIVRFLGIFKTKIKYGIVKIAIMSAPIIEKDF